MCGTALGLAPTAPLAALRTLFDDEYGDDGPAFCDLCVTQYELGADPEGWRSVADDRAVAVVHVQHDALPSDDQAAGAQTFVVEGDDLSDVPDLVKPLVAKDLRQRHTGELKAAPHVRLFERQERRQAMQVGSLVLVLLLAALVWFVGMLLGFWSMPFGAVSSGIPTSPKP